MSLVLVNGQWQQHAPNPSQGSAVAPAPLPVTLRPLPSSRTSADDYAAKCKDVLSARARRALLLCFAPTAVATFLVKLLSISSLFDPLLFALRSAAWSLAVSAALLPLLVLRGRRRTTRRVEATTKLRRYTSLLFDREPRETLAAYLGSAAALSALLALQSGAEAPWKFALAGVRGGDWQLNEAFLFHTIVLFSFATLSAVRHALRQRNVVLFPDEPTLISARFTSALLRGLPPVLANAAATYFFSIVGFGMFTFVRKPLIRFLLHYTPLVALFRHHLHALYRGGGVGRGTLTFIGFELGVLSVLWEHLNVLADVYFTQYMLVSGGASNPAKALLEGMQHKDPFVQHFAYQELSLLAQADPTRRISIYKDIRSAPNGFARISRECLVLLGRSYRLAEGRGTLKAMTPPPASSATAGSTATEGTAQPMMERATVQRETAIFRPARKSFFDKLSLSGRAAAAAPPPATGPPPTGSATGQQQGPPPIVPDILRSRPADSSAPAPPSSSSAPPPASSAPPPYNPMAGLESYLVTRVPQVFGPLPASPVSACMPDPKLNIWACEALSNLVAHSLQEDDFGVVQQELPKILEAFVTYLAALEGLVDELNKAGPEAQDAVLHTVAPVVAAIQSGLSRMVVPFAPYLSNFRFPSRVAARVQLAVDWGTRQHEEGGRS